MPYLLRLLVAHFLILLAFALPAFAQEVKLTASDGAEFDEFGSSVSVSGDLALVGAYLDDDNGNDSGSAYVYRWDGSSWVEEAKLTASDGAEDDQLGSSVSVSGDVAFVAAVFDDDNGDASGSAYVYDLPSIVSVEDEAAAPGFALTGLYPNPTRSHAEVAYKMGVAAHVRVALFDVLGRRVLTVHGGPVTAGAHTAEVATAGLPAGVYVVRIVADGVVETRRLTVVD